jgi:hypothetical protein
MELTRTGSKPDSSEPADSTRTRHGYLDDAMSFTSIRSLKNMHDSEPAPGGRRPGD